MKYEIGDRVMGYSSSKNIIFAGQILGRILNYPKKYRILVDKLLVDKDTINGTDLYTWVYEKDCRTFDKDKWDLAYAFWLSYLENLKRAEGCKSDCIKHLGIKQ